MATTYPADSALPRFRRLATITLLAVYFLILVGASVRASGAGMGCPDWPTCFGSWIPPTDESQLPANYQEIYSELGYADTRFNVVKTWTEYMNRLLGVTIGLLIFATAVVSWPLRRLNRRITWASIATFLMVGFQGWLGSRVGRSILQVTMGTQVREMTDILRVSQGEELRSAWIEAMPWFFYVHRSFSAFVLFANLWLARLLINSLGWMHTLTRLTIGMIVIIGVAVTSGATLGHLGMPALVQPLHLLAATLLFGLQFLIWMSYRHARDGGLVSDRASLTAPVDQAVAGSEQPAV
jgi:cytochrome c oxidase assembly protein subunit 15